MIFKKTFIKTKISLLVLLLIFSSLSSFLSGCSNHEKDFSSENFIDISNYENLKYVIDLMSDKDFVLLGESTHGTQEYYEIRRIISQDLIKNHNFNYIAVEGDWNSIYQLNLYIKGLSDKNSAKEVMNDFNRWPTWMWANKEIEKLSEWLKEFNKNVSNENKISFFGFDVYDVESSISVIEKQTNITYDCLNDFKNDFSLYARHLSFGNSDCIEEVYENYNYIKNLEVDEKNLFFLKQNALIIKNAERHYRAMVDNSLSSWNERVFHMQETLEKLEDFGKGIIWAHNTHVGDARKSQMAMQNSVNIGQLLREANKNVFILGFGTFKGEVLAGRQWGSEMEIMKIPQTNRNSYEYVLSNKGLDKTLILFDENLPYSLKRVNNNRAIGVVYNPTNEYPGNYVNTQLTERYDAFVFINETNALVLN